MPRSLQTRRRKSSRQQLQFRLRSNVARFERDFSLCVGHVERERESIITNADIDTEREYTLLIDHSFSASTTSTWYIDNGASSYMTSAQEIRKKVFSLCWTC